jgi:hypothetical protein
MFRLAATLFLLPVLVSSRVIMFGDSMFSNNAVKGALERLADGRVTIENSALVGASFHDGYVCVCVGVGMPTRRNTGERDERTFDAKTGPYKHVPHP